METEEELTLESPPTPEGNGMNGDEKQKKVKKDKKEKKEKNDSNKSKGVDTMFRIMANNNIRLSKMADDKAHFLLTINSIIISLLVSVVLRKIDEVPQYIVPTILFLVTSLVTFVLAIMVTTPIITHGKFKKEDVENKKADLMFFGNYHNMNIKDYEWGMNLLIKDNAFVYENMIRDNYHMGLVLDRKYKMLRISFRIFMIGFIISTAIFLVADHVL